MFENSFLFLREDFPFLLVCVSVRTGSLHSECKPLAISPEGIAITEQGLCTFKTGDDRAMDMVGRVYGWWGIQSFVVLMLCRGIG